MTDQLAAIKQSHTDKLGWLKRNPGALLMPRDYPTESMDWLIAEVERLRKIAPKQAEEV